MSARLFPLVHGVRVWTETYEDIHARLKEHLRRLREDRMRELLALGVEELSEEQLDLPLGDEGWRAAEMPPLEVSVEITRADEIRLSRRARRIIAARERGTGLGHLREAERKVIEARFPGVRLVGPRTEHEADELAAALLEEMPWLAGPIDHVWRGARRSASEGLGLHFGPLLLDGPPAAGKTYLARRVAELARTPLVEVDLGAGGEAFRIAGVVRGWGSAQPGRPIEEMLASGIGNPTVAVDEVDKGGAARGSDGYRTSALHALLGLLEPGTAQAWECPFYRVRFNMGRVNWILLANDVSQLPAPLLSRARVYSVRQPTPAELCGVAMREGARRGLDAESLEALCRAVLRARGAMTLRHLMRALDALGDALRRDALH